MIYVKINSATMTSYISHIDGIYIHNTYNGAQPLWVWHRSSRGHIVTHPSRSWFSLSFISSSTPQSGQITSALTSNLDNPPSHVVVPPSYVTVMPPAGGGGFTELTSSTRKSSWRLFIRSAVPREKVNPSSLEGILMNSDWVDHVTVVLMYNVEQLWLLHCILLKFSRIFCWPHKFGRTYTFFILHALTFNHSFNHLSFSFLHNMPFHLYFNLFYLMFCLLYVYIFFLVNSRFSH